MRAGKKTKAAPPAPAPAPAAPPQPSNSRELVAPKAREQAEALARKLAEVQSTLQTFVVPANRMHINNARKRINVGMQSIAATKSQIRKCVVNFNQFISTVDEGAPRTFVFSTISDRCLSQVTSNNMHTETNLAFPLAEVIVQLSTMYPELLQILLAKMQRQCIFAIPKYLPYRKAWYATETEHNEALGHQRDKDSGALEPRQTFLNRVTGTVVFLAAIMQVDNPNNPHGIDQAWLWLSFFLNRLPATLETASALLGFLQVAGFRMCQVYKGQFFKLLRAVNDVFMVRLAQKADPDKSAIITRFNTYMNERRWLQPPKGRNMVENAETSQRGYENIIENRR
mmetsp:Transcript_26412/g.86639  ORF Transcript_26412/g.86639 Transcript_26412/m.86639 type:complete len:341 (-) Transcript_26412:64-1086(-)